MELRPYQQDLYDDIRTQLANRKKSVCAVLGCGGGKSCIEASIAKSATDKGSRVLFLVHRAELCEQIARTFETWGVNPLLCDIMMVQTATRRIDRLKPPKLMITDEAHHCLSDSYVRIYDAFPGVTRVGFTATPMRINEGGLGKVFDALVEGVSTKWLIDNHYLAPYKYFTATLADASKLHVRRGDYSADELAALMENAKIYGDTVENYTKFADGKQTIVYCASIAASMATAEKFNSAGITAAHLDGETPKEKRAETVAAFRRGEINVLCNVDLFGEGFDVPDCECVILLRPTKSLTLFIQQSMRSMRYKPDKTAIIIDHVRNVYQHGFPDDRREWTLEAKEKRAKGEISIRECPHCFAAMPAGEKVCPICGYVFEQTEREQAEEVDAEISEVTGTDLRKAPYGDYKKCKTWPELCRFQKAKGYKFAWVVFRACELGIDIPQNYRIYAGRITQNARA